MIREICFDLETTGLSVEEGHKIVEIGLVELIDHKPTGVELQFLINPKREIPEEVINIHGITNEMVADKKVFADVIDEVIKFINREPNTILIAHNAKFDMKFLNNELEKNNKSILQNTVIDTLELARYKFPYPQKNTLVALCERYNIDISERVLHRALSDTILLSKVYLKLIDFEIEEEETFKGLGLDIEETKKVTIDSIQEQIEDYKKFINKHEETLKKYKNKLGLNFTVRDLLNDIFKDIQSLNITELIGVSLYTIEVKEILEFYYHYNLSHSRNTLLLNDEYDDFKEYVEYKQRKNFTELYKDGVSHFYANKQTKGIQTGNFTHIFFLENHLLIEGQKLTNGQRFSIQGQDNDFEIEYKIINIMNNAKEHVDNILDFKDALVEETFTKWIDIMDNEKRITIKPDFVGQLKTGEKAIVDLKTTKETNLKNIMKTSEKFHYYIQLSFYKYILTQIDSKYADYKPYLLFVSTTNGKVFLLDCNDLYKDSLLETDYTMENIIENILIKAFEKMETDLFKYIQHNVKNVSNYYMKNLMKDFN